MKKLVILIFCINYLFYMNSCKQNHSKETGHIHAELTDVLEEHDHGPDETQENLADHDHENNANIQSDEHVHIESEVEHEHEGEIDAEHSENESGHSEIAYESKLIQRKSFNQIISCSGEILLDKKDEIIISSKTNGIIKFTDHFLYPGMQVSKNQNLFSISGENIAENNMTVRYKQLKSKHQQALRDYERAKELFADKLISEKDYLEYASNFESIEAEFKNIESNLFADGGHVTSGIKGYVKEVFVKEGEYVNIGDPLASVIVDHNMVLKAFVAPEFMNQIKQVKSANFKTNYSKKIYELSELNGEKLSVGRSSAENSFYIPIFFKLDYQQNVIPGTFVEVFLIGESVENAIVVPNSSILEEYGKYYVYLDMGNEEFDKKYIEIGGTDGLNTLITSGLAEGQKVVCQGAYQVKLSQVKSLPAHSHSH